MDATPAQRFARERTFHHSRWSTAAIAATRTRRVSVCLPARECASTVGPIVQSLVGLRAEGVLDDIVVIDAGSRDGTAAVAREAGAVVHQEIDLMDRLGPVLGKGDAMYRALGVLEGELICFLDADTRGDVAAYARGLIGALVCEPGVSFAKAFYRRPYEQDGVSIPDGGGRVNHLTARPALALFYPELAGVRQPLAGEAAATRELLLSLPFTTGYGVEIAMLIDAWRAVGLDGMAQVDMDVHHNAHQSVAALSRMSYAVLSVIATRLAREGRLSGFAPATLLGAGGVAEPVTLVERPPLASVLGRLAGGGSG